MQNMIIELDVFGIVKAQLELVDSLMIILAGMLVQLSKRVRSSLE